LRDISDKGYYNLFGTFHAMEDRDRFDALTWWETYGSHGLLPKLAKKVLSQVVNSKILLL